MRKDRRHRGARYRSWRCSRELAMRELDLGVLDVLQEMELDMPKLPTQKSKMQKLGR